MYIDYFGRRDHVSAALRATAAGRPAGKSDLRQERLACGVTDDGGSDALTGSTKVGPGEYLIPGAARIASTLFGEVELMLRPLEGERAPISHAAWISSSARVGFPATT